MTLTRVLVVGSINADDSIRVRRAPRPGETVSADAHVVTLGGKGANQAVAAARAGANVEMVGAVGEADGAAMLTALEGDGVGTRYIARVPGVATGRAIVVVDDDGENSIIVIPGANAAIPDALIDEACATLAPGDVVVLQHEVPAATSQRAAQRARAAGATVVWNAAPAPLAATELVRDIDVLVVNEHELRATADLLGTGATEDGEAGHPLVETSHALGVDVICTVGPEGAIYRVSGSTGSAPSRPVTAIDTTAAGDTFVGYYAAGAGQAFDVRLRTALIAASLTVTRRGAAESIPTLDEVTPHVPSSSSERTPS